MSASLRALLDPRAQSSRKLGLPARVALAWRRIADRLLPLGGSSDGNQITLFFDGDSAYDAMLAAIRSAKHRVWLETYIFEVDRAGTLFLQALLDARRRGVEVALLYDSVGSPRLHAEQLRPLVEAGARVAAFNPPFQLHSGLPALMRDHRKILLVDRGIGFCGGMNISEDYAGPKHGNGRFRDTHALVEGPAADDLDALFRATFLTATGGRLPAPSGEIAPLAEGVFAQVLASDVRRRKRHIQRALYHTVGRCLSRCLLTTPYFVPPPRLVRALITAAGRGVDVRLLTAGVSDVPLVAVAARHLYGHLLQGGVRIFEMEGRTLHAKTATIDGIYASVGSFNLDRWSFARNLEVSLTVVDEGLARHLEEQFHADLELCREITLRDHEMRGAWVRLKGWAAYRLLRL